MYAINSFLAMDDFCRLLITLQTVWTQIRRDVLFDTDSVLIRIFLKKYVVVFFKKSTEDNKSMKNYPACKELISV